MIRQYSQLVFTGFLTKSTQLLLYTIAIHHLNAFLFDQTRSENFNLQKTLLKSFKDEVRWRNEEKRKFVRNRFRLDVKKRFDQLQNIFSWWTGDVFDITSDSCQLARENFLLTDSIENLCYFSLNKRKTSISFCWPLSSNDFGRKRRRRDAQ